MKCFVCKGSGQTNNLIKGTIERNRCPHCSPTSYFFLTQPSLRQGSQFFETMINKPGFDFLGTDKLNSASTAVELGTVGKKISNLYLKYSLKDYNADFSSLTAKEAKGRGELISVRGNYLKGLIIEKMTEAQKKEVLNSNLLTKDQKEYIVKLIGDNTSIRNVRLASGQTAYTLSI